MISIEKLCKRFGDIQAVKSISLEIPSGEIFGFLGPNGAGKSTTIKMLCTLLKPSSGTALLSGFDIEKEAHKVRRNIGLVFQDPSLDEALTAYENLKFHAILYGLSSAVYKERIEQVLKMVELWDRRNAIVKTFSGGMKRRLEIARGLIHYPKILFLDEPTLGLDPQSRNHIWSYINDLRLREDITIFMTTHYMEEAELCNRIAIIDNGEIIVLDTPENLKKQVGRDIISLKSENLDLVEEFLLHTYNVEVKKDKDQLFFEVDNGAEFLPAFINTSPVSITSIGLRTPTLDDVFLKLTGRAIRDENVSSLDNVRQHVRARRVR